MAQLGARLDGIEEVVGSNPIGSTKKITVLFEIFHGTNTLAPAIPTFGGILPGS